MKKRYAQMVASTLLATSLLSCHKELDMSPSNITPGVAKAQDANTYFEWYTAQQMPTAGAVVAMPWNAQSGAFIDAAIISDYKPEDGWVLVYNTFNNSSNPTIPSSSAGGNYFALYNRFRGILRYYYYVPYGFFGKSTQIEHGLGIYTDNGTSSKMLNLEGTDIVDAERSVPANGNGTPAFIKTSTRGVNTSGGWYAMQYQIGYDPNFASTTFPHLGFALTSTNIDVTQISVKGTQQGTINGQVTQIAPKIDFGTVVNGVLMGAEILAVASIDPAASASAFVKNLGDAANGGLSGNTTGFLSGIFGGNAGNPQEVDLTMNTTIALSGTETSTQPFWDSNFIFPGQTSVTYSPAPLTTEPLGLFNLVSRPVVNVHTTRVSSSGSTYTYNNVFSISTSDFTNAFKTNPAVINGNANGAQITHLKTEVVVINPAVAGLTTSATKELFAGNIIYSGINSLSLRYATRDDTAAGEQQDVIAGVPVAIRVSFNVQPNTPNANAPVPFIVKTFYANVIFN